MNLSYTSEQILTRLLYVVTLKQMSVANARGYIPYSDVNGLSILWGYNDMNRTAGLVDAIDAIFAVYKETGHLDEDYFTKFRPFLPGTLVFIKHVDHVDEGNVIHWLFSITLKDQDVSNESVINLQSYKDTMPPLVRFSETMINYGRMNGAFTNVYTEIYNPLIYQGLAPIKKSHVSGLSFIDAELVLMFGDTVKVLEIIPEHMIALISEHVFVPEITYLGNVTSKSQVDDIYAPTMSDTEIIHERSRRLDIVMANLPNVTVEEVERNNARLFKTINPTGSLARHYAFVRGDLVELRTIIPSGKSSSSRKNAIYLVQ